MERRRENALMHSPVTSSVVTDGRKAGFLMTKRTVGLTLASGVLALTAVLQASDMVGIYGVVEKVVVEPNDKAPERIQIWGAFAIAEGRGSTYGPAQRGYLYYTCPSGQENVCRKEWSDLKSVAGKGTAVGLGMRYKPTGRRSEERRGGKEC